MSPSFLLVLLAVVSQAPTAPMSEPTRPPVLLLPPETTEEPPRTDIRLYLPEQGQPAPSGPNVGNPPPVPMPLPNPGQPNLGQPNPGPGPIVERRPDAVLHWNAIARTAIRVDQTPPPIAARNMAVLSTAVCDSVSAVLDAKMALVIDVKVAPKMIGDPVAVEAAAIASAHRVLVNLYPQQQAALDEAFCKSVSELPASPYRDPGVVLGRLIADKALEWRAGDCRYIGGTHQAREGFGLWRPTAPDFTPALIPDWAKAPAFAVREETLPKLKGPPALNSNEYWNALTEVRIVGARDSTVRTAEQTEIANFWADGVGTSTPVGHWNKIAADVSRTRGLSLADNARMFAMLNMCLADAGRVCWGIKFHTDFWRPITAIRLIADPAAPNVPLHPNWEPMLQTPPFPTYTSGHSTFSGAGAAALARFFGSDEIRFESTSEGLPGVRRTFPGFSAAASEAGRSRIFGGIHFEFDNADGLLMGKAVAENVIDNAFRPRPDLRTEAFRRPLP
jgi:hypothetical protein